MWLSLAACSDQSSVVTAAAQPSAGTGPGALSPTPPGGQPGVIAGATDGATSTTPGTSAGQGGGPGPGVGDSPLAAGGQGVAGSPPLTAQQGCSVYASPAGAGNECSAQSPCSLVAARDKVRTLNGNMTEDLQVCLAGGTYSLSGTFALSETSSLHDSGTNGHSVVYRALDAQAPVLSGGQRITGFTLADATKNIYSAPAARLSSRQLFVNGRRATRARSKDNYGMVRAERGFTANTSALASFKNPSHIELTGELDWRHYRCPVESISGSDIRLQNPCWDLSQDVPGGGWWNFKEVNWVENAYELLDEAGEFYLDETESKLYYMPRAGEDMAQADVVMPVLETLVRGQGSAGQPLRNIAFRGITFAYATWSEPSSAVGYTPWQSGFLHQTRGQYDDWGFYPMPSNLVFENVAGIRFEGNRFTHLGASGLDLFRGSSNNSVVGNRFDDISGRAITLGHINDADVPDAAVIKNNLIQNNYLVDSGVEYRDCAIIFVGYTQDTVIEHNWLRGGPYIGISLGWGWTNHPQSTAGRNLIRYNRIEDFMQHTFDGSGVYALGPQRGSSVDHNYIYRGLPRGEGIFPDQGAAFMAWQSNVIEDVGWQWIHDWSSQAHDNVIRNNITNQPNFEHNGGADKRDVFENNVVVTNGSWPSETNDIKANAGLESAYADLAK